MGLLYSKTVISKAEFTPKEVCSAFPIREFVRSRYEYRVDGDCRIDEYKEHYTKYNMIQVRDPQTGNMVLIYNSDYNERFKDYIYLTFTSVLGETVYWRPYVDTDQGEYLQQGLFACIGKVIVFGLVAGVIITTAK